MRATATRIALLAAALALAAVPAAAGAKSKKKKPKATPVSVVSASKTTSAVGEAVTVTASCPAGKIAVGGGFESPAFPGGGTVTDLNFVHESRRASSASWQVSAVRSDGGTPGPALAATALAYCRTPKLKPKATKKAAAAKKKKKKKKKKLRITEVSATSAPAPGSGIASATATCPGKQTPISGGFSSSPPPSVAGGYPIFYASLRSANAWTATAFNSGPDPRTVTSYAYCIRPPGPTERVGSATLPASSSGPPTVLEAATATTPACSKSTSLVAGGFSHSPIAPGTTAIPLTTSSLASGKSWSAGALNLGLFAGSLGARGYCL